MPATVAGTGQFPSKMIQWKVQPSAPTCQLLRRVFARQLSLSLHHGIAVQGRCYASAQALSDMPDLHRNVPQGSHWQDIKTWVVFSDLHVSTKTAEVCQQVLAKVRQEAEARNAGILFLGDFWHLRGSLPVTPLNLVLGELKRCTQPTLMLVGNHDQVSLGGLEHGLTPIAAACPNVHVFEEPTLFMDALWLPYRREKQWLTQAIQAAGPVKAIFGHADVLGAYVNESFQAKEGLDPGAFSEVQTFLGHYHKPQVVGSKIRYVGSPYQVSRSESSQKKEVIVLNARWKQVDSIPIDLGPRHFNLSTASEIAPTDLRKGDRVRWMKDTDAEDPDVEQNIQQLRSQGVEVEIVTVVPESAPRIQGAENIGPVALFEAYAEASSMPSEAKARGLDILQDLEATMSQPSDFESAHIEMETVELKGFGPFLQLQSYSLRQGGVRVITGRNEDDLGSESNGAGKSALVMAALWALTGRSDARTMTGAARGLTGPEIVNDHAKAAQVCIKGKLNGQGFELIRTQRQKGSANLKLAIDGKDMTQNTSKLTQELVDDKFRCDLLTKTVFHSQSDVMGLFEAGDKEFKAELGKIVSLDLWENAKTVAIARLKGVEEEVVRAEQTISIKSQDLERCSRQAEDLRERSRILEEERQEKLFHIQDDLSHAAVDLRYQMANAQQAVTQLKQLLKSAGPLPALMPRSTIASTEIPHAPDMASFRSQHSPDVELAEQLQLEVRQLQNTVLELRSAANQRLGSVEVLKANLQKFGSTLGDVSAGHQVCDRCLQPIDAHIYNQNVARMQSEISDAELQHSEAADLAQSKQAEIEAKQNDFNAQNQTVQSLWTAFEKDFIDKRDAMNALKARATAEQELAASRRTVELDRRKAAEEIVEEANKLLAYCESKLKDCAPGMANPIANAVTLDSLTLDSAISELKLLIRNVEAAGSKVESVMREKEAVTSLENPHAGAEKMLGEMIASADSALQQARSELAWQKPEAGWLKALATAFDRNGIQSFALEGVLGELQARTAHFLESLSSGMKLTLAAHREASGRSKESVERITKIIRMQTDANTVRERTARQLSGGERRRVALALTLGYADLIGARSRLQCNLLVLDEILQQLDAEGCANVAKVLRNMGQKDILLVGQADSLVTQLFDRIDTVVKRNGCSFVEAA